MNISFHDYVNSILRDYHFGMTTMEVAKKYSIDREEVMLWLEKEENGDLDEIIFADT